MLVFDNSKPLIWSLQRFVGEKIDAYLVNISQKDGLKKAMELDSTKKPIILYSFKKELKELIENPIIQTLLNKRRIGYIEDPLRLDNLFILYQKLLNE